jgi:hypothetical protein
LKRMRLHRRYALGVLVAFTAIFTATVPPHAEAEECRKYQPLFDTLYTANAHWIESEARAGRGTGYYYFSYVFGGTLAMFEGTGDLKYIERMFGWTDAMIKAATIVDARGKKNWSGAWSSPWADAPIPYMLEDLQASTELARLARVALTDPNLRSIYGTRANAAYRFVKEHIVDKWLYTRNSAWWFEKVAQDDSKDFSDKVALLVRLLLDLYQIDGNGSYASLATHLLEELKQRLMPHYDSSLVWDRDSSRAPDTAHANRIPVMLVDAYAAGISVSSAEIRGVSNLLTRIIWDGSSTSPRFTNHIDGGNSEIFGRPPWANGLIYSGWVTLGAYDAQAQRVAEAVLHAIIAGADNPSLAYMKSPRGKLALMGYITRNMRVAGACS